MKQKILFSSFNPNMRIESFTAQQNSRNKLALGHLSIRTDTLAEVFERGVRVIDVFEHEPQRSLEELEALGRFYQKIQHEHAMEYLDSLSPRGRKAADKILALDGYEHLEQLAGSFLYYKPKELEELYSVVSPRDIAGEMRYQGIEITQLFGMQPERLKLFKPIILSKNDMGLWNYNGKFINQLDRLADRPLEVIGKLTDCKIFPESLLGIVSNPTLNWEKTVEKAQSIKKLFGKDLREVAFLSNRHGQNFLSVDVQLPHNPDKPDYFNFKRLYALLDKDVNPINVSQHPQLDRQVENIYQKMEKQLHLFTEKDLDKIISNLTEEVSNASEQDILTVMQKLTQFANYSCLPKLSEQLRAKNICEISEQGPLNAVFKYFNMYKGILPLSDDISGKTAFILDRANLNSPKHLFPEEDMTYINLEGWNDGVNFISDDAKLEAATKRVLIAAKKIVAKNKDCTLEEAVSHVLNNKVKAAAKEAGINVTTIRLDAPATRSVVLDQMRPLMPTKSLIKSTIESIAKHYCKEQGKTFDDLCLGVGKYYEDNINVFSKQSMLEKIKEINTLIDNFLERNNLSRENLYFVKSNLPPSMVKSFDLINKMNADLYDIPMARNIRLESFLNHKRYPTGSTFVILDDVVGTGNSMLEMGEYMFTAKSLPRDKHVLFCPITSSKGGYDYIQDFIKMAGRQGVDEIITPAGSIKDYSEANHTFIKNSELAEAVMGEIGDWDMGMCTTFPYMTPDNNSRVAGYLTKFFLPDNKAIKAKNDLLPVIEEETLYYDIFGTDKEHVITDGMEVFNYDPNSWATYFTNLFRRH